MRNGKLIDTWKIPTAGLTLSMAHFRWSQGQSGQTVLDGPLLAVQVGQAPSTTADFLASLQISQQSRQNLYAFYPSWVEKLEAYAASRLTGRFVAVTDSITIQRRRAAYARRLKTTRLKNALVAAFKSGQFGNLKDLPHPVASRRPETAFDYVSWCVEYGCVGETAARLLKAALPEVQ